MRVLVLFGSCALLAGGVLVGMSLEHVDSTSADGSEEDGMPVVVNVAHGTERLTIQEAADRIELLEATIRRRRVRDARSAADGDEFEDAAASRDGDGEALPPQLRHADGRPYSLEELRDVALNSDDPELRRRAIRAMRWHDSDAARDTLQALLANDELSQEERLEAARALARPPHRDKLPEKLLGLIGEEDDPEIRAALAQGIARLRSRGAWMSEISALLAKETDPAVRKEIFAAVARSSRDPAARQELLDIAVGKGTPEERQMAIRALTRGSPDAATLAAMKPLLEDADPVLRANALRILASGRQLGLAQLGDVLNDSDPSVRAQALWYGARLLPSLGKGKKAKNPAYQSAVSAVVQMAAHDPDSGVRRAAINRVWSLPKKERARVLETGRADTDTFVRLSAYAASGAKVARTATPDFLGALESSDRGMRDFAYRQLRRLHGVDVPYNAGWNTNARTSAAAAIRRVVAETWKPE